MSARPGPARTSAAVLAALLLTVVAGCRQPARQLDMERADRRINLALAASYHLPVSELRCPAHVDASVGATFRCTLLVAGHPLTVVVTQHSGAGDLTVKATAAVLVMEKVRATMILTLTVQLKKTNLIADCGRLQVQVVAPGHSIACTVSNGKQNKHVSIRVLDVNGTVRYLIS